MKLRQIILNHIKDKTAREDVYANNPDLDENIQNCTTISLNFMSSDEIKGILNDIKSDYRGHLILESPLDGYDFDLRSLKIKSLYIASNLNKQQIYIKISDTLNRITLFGCTKLFLDIKDRELNFLSIQKCQADINLSNCLVHDLRILRNDELKLTLDDTTKKQIKYLQIITSKGFEDTTDANYFFTKEHLKMDSNYRGEASIYDTGLFDFKSKI